MTPSQVLQFLPHLVCSILFGLMCRQQVLYFLSEPTSTTLRLQEEKNIPFPSISICNEEFAFRDPVEQMGIHSFLRPFPNFRSKPHLLFEKLDLVGLPIFENLWKNAFTLDKVIFFTEGNRPGQNMDRCTVGGVSCIPVLAASDVTKGIMIKPLLIPTNESQIVEADVPAGKWRSTFMMGMGGSLSMCHTLIPNVTTQFAHRHGESIRLRWHPSLLINASRWTVYVHNNQEHVVLDTYLLEDLPRLDLARPKEDDPSTELSHRIRAKLKANLHAHPDPSKVHDCSEDPDYSVNLCRVQEAWAGRFSELELKYGDKFSCQVPGIKISPDKAKPLCQKFDRVDEADPLGFLQLTQKTWNDIDVSLTEHPIGHFATGGACQDKCHHYIYDLETQAYPDQEVDLYLYFASPVVEVREEYRIQTGLDFAAALGGSMGLLLGWSIVSIALLVGSTIKLLFKYLKKMIHLL